MPLPPARGIDSAGLTLRQKLRLPPMRLGARELGIPEGFVTSLKADTDGDVGEWPGLAMVPQWWPLIS